MRNRRIKKVSKTCQVDRSNDWLVTVGDYMFWNNDIKLVAPQPLLPNLYASSGTDIYFNNNTVISTGYETRYVLRDIERQNPNKAVEMSDINV